VTEKSEAIACARRVYRMVDTKIIIKEWRAKEEERYKGLLTQRKGRKKTFTVKAVHSHTILDTYAISHITTQSKQSPNRRKISQSGNPNCSHIHTLYMH
jgi:hypothetical protein